MIKVAPLRYGVIFKKAFCHPEIFTAFVEDFVGIKLEIDHVETEKSFDPPVGKVNSRFDLFAEDKKNRVIVDIQHARYKDHYDRFLHYHCSAILEQVASSKSYKNNLQVYTLVILTSGDYHQNDIAVIDFDPKTLDGKPLGEIAHKIIYICPPYVNDNTPEPLRQWMQAIKDTQDGEVDETIYHKSEILKIFDYIKQDLISVDDRTKMIDEYGENDLRQDLFDKGMEKGIEKGEISMLHHLLEKRFKSLPNWVDEQLNQADSTQLKSYFDRALNADSLEQVFE
ncbi:MAG: PD-(D/E)XK nuclease family transposase [Candidatus Marithrix sp.]|nr:PD-(D/E)XK nuclease family transposase [Candidatus Marithrix sp.]